MLSVRQVKSHTNRGGPHSWYLCNLCGLELEGSYDDEPEYVHRGAYKGEGEHCPTHSVPNEPGFYAEFHYDSYEEALEEAEGYQFYVDAMVSYYSIEKGVMADRALWTAANAEINAATCRGLGLDAWPVIYEPLQLCHRYDSYVAVFDHGEPNLFVNLEMIKASHKLAGEFLYRTSAPRALSAIDQIVWALRDEAPKPELMFV